ncbi:MAG: Uma2 family endonuclease [Rhodoferax sp.]|nr:Uma2 family endonuclease [Rhodoferax sp.]
MHRAYQPRFTAAGYLEGEVHSTVRHEFVDGEVYAMAGAGEAHNLIAGNVFARLRSAVRGGPCRVFISDMKLHVAAWNAFYYPDVMVVCNAADAHTHYKESPSVIVEVLSDSTAGTDRREKLLAYRTLASLREYVLIAQDQRQIDIYRRAPDGANDVWLLESLGDGDGDLLQLESLEVGMSMAEVYEDVVFMNNQPVSLVERARAAIK